MVGRLVLMAIQFVVAGIATPATQKIALVTAQYQQYANGLAAGVVIWGVGLIAAQPLKSGAIATPGRLLGAVAGGLIGGTVVALRLLEGSGIKLPPPLVLILVPALLGYHVSR